MTSEPEADGFLFRVFLGGRGCGTRSPLVSTSLFSAHTCPVFHIPAASSPRHELGKRFSPKCSCCFPGKPGCEPSECPGGCRTAWRGGPANPAGLPLLAHWVATASRGSLQGGFTFWEPTQGFVGCGPGVSQLLGWQRACGWEPPRAEEAKQPLAWILLSPVPQHQWPWGRAEGARPSEQAGFHLRARSGQGAAALTAG